MLCHAMIFQHSSHVRQVQRRWHLTLAVGVVLKLSIVMLATVLTMPAVRASCRDLHWLWDDRCATCHGHAGDFARHHLINSSGELQGRHHVYDLRRFLHNHYLAGIEVDAVYDMLLAQTDNPARFRGECMTCHDNASALVRSSLELRNGILYSRRSGLPVRRFLDRHMELSPDDVEFFLTLLTRVAHEVCRSQ
jgi:hypothetical protein